MAAVFIRAIRWAVAAAVVASASGCGSSPAEGEGAPAPKKTCAAIPCEALSEYGFFAGEIRDLSPAEGVVPYQVASPLWSDGAGKERAVVVPEGKKIVFHADEEWEVPDGAIVIKSFYFPLDRRDPEGARRIIETRLLVRDSSVKEGWTAHTYVWNDAQTEALRVIAGEKVTIDFIDEAGDPASQLYLVPNTNQCKSCHTRDDTYRVLGLDTRQVNHEVTADGAPKGQLERLAEQGIFEAPPPAPEALPALVDPQGSAPLNDRARSYLHANCSHCHRPGSGGGASGLVLLAWEESPTKLGVCKGAVAAGSGTGMHLYDVVPGEADESIMVFRMSSSDPEIKMPEIPNLLPDNAGVELIREWINAMSPPGCP